MGTRGVPARYGGFETAVEEVGRRLAVSAHEVTVYCRGTADSDVEGVPSPGDRYLGMRRVVLPALRSKSLETLSHSALSCLDAVTRRHFDVVFLFNAANAVFLPILHARRLPVAVHVDGLEWQRSKWSGAGQRYYRVSETLAARWGDALIADAPGIARYYRDEFGASTELISYGAEVLEAPSADRLAELGLQPDGFHLVVARFEPENHVAEIVRGYRRSDATLPLVVVGSAPYSADYTRRIDDAAGDDPRIRLLGGVWDQQQLDQLYAHCRLYLHGHSVGGTNPSLLRAMGAGARISAYDVEFNRDVLGDAGRFFVDPDGVAEAVLRAESDADVGLGERLQQRVRSDYRWDDVAERYAELAHRLRSGATRRGECSGRRRRDPAQLRRAGGHA